MHALIAGVSSGIGSAIAAHLAWGGWDVSGTSRRPIHGALATCVRESVICDFAASSSVDEATLHLASSTDGWDLMVVAPGTMKPIGAFAGVDFDSWSKSVNLNLINQLRFVHGMLPHANRTSGRTPLCVFIAGGGTNSAPVAVSAYTISKVALIKATEILDAEMQDVAFTILGPGWIRTPIHEEILESSDAPDEVLHETRRRMEANDFTPMRRVLDALDWLLSQPKDLIGGRNFSVSGDPFEQPDFTEFLRREPTAFRLRRSGNDAYWTTRGR